MNARLDALRALVDEALVGAVGALRGADGAAPSKLREAMGYALLGGGKRMRPVLVLAACEAVGAPPVQALPFAVALEMVHAYSLVHDDLPCMDDDDERRGRPTVHIAFGEATAVLVGDALLTEAFGVLARASGAVPAETRLRLVALLAEAAGAAGMVGGQQLDMDAAEVAPALEVVRALHAMKTGALFRAAVLGGGLAGGADEARAAALERYGVAIGRAFQVTDDLIELEAGEVAPDDAHEAAVSLALRLGVEGARQEAAALVAQARGVAQGFGARGAVLDAIAAMIERRRS